MILDNSRGINATGRVAHWAKLAFEKYFLWKMQRGYVGLP